MALAAAVLAACRGSEAPAGPAAEPAVDSAALALALVDGVAVPRDTIVPVGLRTTSGSTEFVHPDVVERPGGWHGWRYWMAVTPYPRTTASTPDQQENPSIFVSNNGRWWVAPPGLGNPVVLPGAGSHLSDPDLVFDSSAAALRLYYRETAGSDERVRLMTSGDGLTWSAPRTVLSATDLTLLSPAVVRDSTWRVWHVHADAAGCRTDWTTALVRTSPDGVAWGAMQPVALSPTGYHVWHLDVDALPAIPQYWALVTAYAAGTSCAGTDLFLAISGDGVAWTVFDRPLVRRSDIPALGAAIYRSTMAYDPTSDDVTLWISGQGAEGWSVVTVRWARDEVLRRVGAAGRAAQSVRRRYPTPGSVMR